MQLFRKIIIWVLLAPLCSFLIWIFNDKSFINFLNILFYTSAVLSIITFVLIIVQDGVFDVTSYGFRKLKYQFSTKKQRTSMSDDDFFNPQQVKKDTYVVASWVKYAFFINLIYFVITIVISFSL
ncbi:DUF3899 domain-containing protein [Staphylococcus lloydii]|uniref:DUF3899 domain-containing protein n=1 Tax=Staphylococcus lloydii TaxID=2781774 RepID=UPI00292900EE|nr:DUF3899 domain-containing protein [Staphylococcus lloydii]MDU9417271.1 DUF3899 domain-containing protein [Staphylococcus lloydii]